MTTAKRRPRPRRNITAPDVVPGARFVTVQQLVTWCRTRHWCCIEGVPVPSFYVMHLSVAVVHEHLRHGLISRGVAPYEVLT